MGYKEKLLPNEWRTLQFAPLWVFLATAGADGEIHNRELLELENLLATGQDLQESFGQEVLESVAQEFDDLVRNFDQDNRKYEDGLLEVIKIFDKNKKVLNDNDSDTFKDILLSIGYKIAGAEGLVKSKISTEEENVLQGLGKIFNIPVEDPKSFDPNSRKSLRRHTQSKKIWLIWLFAFVVLVGLIAMGYYTLFCLAAPIAIIAGLIYQSKSRYSRKKLQRGSS